MRSARKRARPLSRVIALLVALLGGLQASGAAASLIGSSIECCCGRHDKDRPCDCPDCPSARAPDRAPFARIGSCHGSDVSRAITLAPSLPPPELPSLLSPIPTKSGAAPPLPSLEDRVPSVPRPPP